MMDGRTAIDQQTTSPDASIARISSSATTRPSNTSSASHPGWRLSSGARAYSCFEPYRINPNREFFRIDPEQAIALLALLADEDVTPGVQEEADDVESDTVARATIAKRSRRPNLNFKEMGIPIGSELRFVNKPDEVVKIIDSKRVEYQDASYSLTKITTTLLGVERSVGPTGYWTYEGRPLGEIYEETYGPRDP